MHPPHSRDKRLGNELRAPHREASDKPALFGLGGLSPSSSFEKLELGKLDLNALNVAMKSRCKSMRSHSSLKNIESEGNLEAEADWHVLVCAILMQLTCALSSTNLKSSIIVPPNVDAAEGIVKSFTEDELEEWKVGVRSGLINDDWVALIKHRTYISDNLLVG